MAIGSEGELERQLTEWRTYMSRRRTVQTTDVDELEDHLRSTIGDLADAGLHPDEAFLVAVKRMGSQDELAREFARVHSDRLWKQLVLSGDPATPTPGGTHRGLLIAVICAAAAAIGIKVPALLGLDFDNDADFYQRNLGFFALVPLTAFLVLRRRTTGVILGLLAALFACGIAGANAYPLGKNSHTLVLTAIHLPLALWFAVGLAYVAGEWRSQRRWMDFVRFTGEWLIYLALIGLGGGVLAGMTAGVFQAIGVYVEDFISTWLIPCGAVSAVTIAAWLVEAKQSVVENMAPVLTRIFTPLFTAAMLTFLGAMVWTGHVVKVERDVLIVFDLLLVVVLGLLLYAISARDPQGRPTVFDRLQLAMAVSALLIDVLVLVSTAERFTQGGGLTPNRAAVLGENIILLANLVWTAVLLTGLVWKRRPFQLLERWQTGYLAVYAVWVWVVVLVFPPVFGFR